MRALLQRVSEARVDIGGETVGQIGHGLLILAGFETADTPDDLSWMVQKILALRIFPDDAGKMNRNVLDTQGGLLVVSQFTLHAKTKKGTRPSFTRAAHPDLAIPLYEAFVRELSSEARNPVETGEFGAMMQVHLVNDGPVTIWLDSKEKE